MTKLVTSPLIPIQKYERQSSIFFRHLHGLARESPPREGALEAFAGCAVIISHDRWFLDRIATHNLAFEDDGTGIWFDGNYSNYEAHRKERFGAKADQPHRITYRHLTRD